MGYLVTVWMMPLEGEDVEGEHGTELEEIVKTINSKVFKELANAALNRIKGLEGIN